MENFSPVTEVKKGAILRFCLLFLRGKIGLDHLVTVNQPTSPNIDSSSMFRSQFLAPNLFISVQIKAFGHLLVVTVTELDCSCILKAFRPGDMNIWKFVKKEMVVRSDLGNRASPYEEVLKSYFQTSF